MKKPVPQLGDDNISFEDVNNFYSFWYITDVLYIMMKLICDCRVLIFLCGLSLTTV